MAQTVINGVPVIYVGRHVWSAGINAEHVQAGRSAQERDVMYGGKVIYGEHVMYGANVTYGENVTNGGNVINGGNVTYGGSVTYGAG